MRPSCSAQRSSSGSLVPRGYRVRIPNPDDIDGINTLVVVPEDEVPQGPAKVLEISHGRVWWQTRRTFIAKGSLASLIG